LGGQNVHEGERWASALAGGGLLAAGLTRPFSLRGLLLLAGGGALLYRGMTGYCHLYGTLGVNTREAYRPETAVPHGRGQKVETVVTVNRPAAELYRFWRRLETYLRSWINSSR